MEHEYPGSPPAAGVVGVHPRWVELTDAEERDVIESWYEAMAEKGEDR
jgi:hypothetical protein